MKWEIYKGLTREERAEWAFKFKHKGRYVPKIALALAFLVNIAISVVYYSIALLYRLFPENESAIFAFNDIIDIGLGGYFVLLIVYISVRLVQYFIQVYKEKKFINACLKC